MTQLIAEPTTILAAGNKTKEILEYIGRVNSDTSQLSIAHMNSPSGWVEPGQRPDFDEYSLILTGMLRVETENGTFDVHEGQAFMASRGDWVRYSTPGPDGASYIAVCLDAFSPETVNRDDSD